MGWKINKISIFSLKKRFEQMIKMVNCVADFCESLKGSVKLDAGITFHRYYFDTLTFLAFKKHVLYCGEA